MILVLVREVKVTRLVFYTKPTLACVSLTYGGQAPVFLLFLDTSTGCRHWLSARLLADAECDLFPPLTTSRLDVCLCMAWRNGQSNMSGNRYGDLYRNFHQGDI